MWQLEDSQKQFVLKGGRGPSFTGTTPPSRLSYTQHPLLLLCLAVTESCSCDHIGSPPFTAWHLELLQRSQELSHPSISVVISFLWVLGDPTSHLHTRRLFQNIQRTELCPVWNGMYPSLSFLCLLCNSAHVLLSLHHGLLQPWPETELTINQQLST